MVLTSGGVAIDESMPGLFGRGVNTPCRKKVSDEITASIGVEYIYRVAVRDRSGIFARRLRSRCDRLFFQKQNIPMSSDLTTARDITEELARLADPEDARNLQRYFKTGPGQYDEGDRFRGIRMPVLRTLAGRCRNVSLAEAEKLLASAYHEDRMLALMILVHAFAKGDQEERRAIYDLYLASVRYINNWDLVDLSASSIVGAYLLDRSKAPLRRLARSHDLWERRIAILSTFHYIRRNEFETALEIAQMLLDDRHDLIHKAVGWMLREIGKRNRAVEDAFLVEHCRSMPRTALRYAIERHPEQERLRFLRGEVDTLSVNL
jgi:3-methyladenine DNA glycosylase AlkD